MARNSPQLIEISMQSISNPTAFRNSPDRQWQRVHSMRVGSWVNVFSLALLWTKQKPRWNGAASINQSATKPT
jgi:hypothetical protein